MTGLASRWTRPSRSRVCRVWASIFSLTPPTWRRSSLNRYERSSSAASTRTPQRLVTCSSTGRDGQSALLTFGGRSTLLALTSVPYFKVGTFPQLVLLVG